jgi:hypothetical protein
MGEHEGAQDMGAFGVTEYMDGKGRDHVPHIWAAGRARYQMYGELTWTASSTMFVAIEINERKDPLSRGDTVFPRP